MNEENRNRAIEICKNLLQTINNMGNHKPIESDSRVYRPIRPKKSFLRNQREKLIEKYNLTKEELK